MPEVPVHLAHSAGEVEGALAHEGEERHTQMAGALRPSPSSLRASTSPAKRERFSASEPLRRFLQVARGAGLRVSAAEGIDAARAVDLVGFNDRAVLKDTLGLVLAKTPDEKGLFHVCFELYFKRDEFASPDAVEPPV